MILLIGFRVSCVLSLFSVVFFSLPFLNTQNAHNTHLPEVSVYRAAAPPPAVVFFFYSKNVGIFCFVLVFLEFFSF